MKTCRFVFSSVQMVLPFLRMRPGCPRFQGNQSLQEFRRNRGNQVHPAEDRNTGRSREVWIRSWVSSPAIHTKAVNSAVHRSWLRSRCIEWTDGCFMFSREEPAFILLLNTPEITEFTPGWSQVPHLRHKDSRLHCSSNHIFIFNLRYLNHFLLLVWMFCCCSQINYICTYI